MSPHFNADYIFWSFRMIGFTLSNFENRILLKALPCFIAGNEQSQLNG